MQVKMRVMRRVRGHSQTDRGHVACGVEIPRAVVELLVSGALLLDAHELASPHLQELHLVLHRGGLLWHMLLDHGGRRDDDAVGQVRVVLDGLRRERPGKQAVALAMELLGLLPHRRGHVGHCGDRRGIAREAHTNDAHLVEEGDGTVDAVEILGRLDPLVALLHGVGGVRLAGELPRVGPEVVEVVLDHVVEPDRLVRPVLLEQDVEWAIGEQAGRLVGPLVENRREQQVGVDLDLQVGEVAEDGVDDLLRRVVQLVEVLALVDGAPRVRITVDGALESGGERLADASLDGRCQVGATP